MLRRVLAEDWESAGFGLYVHWPFCRAKCPYCDFNSHVVKSIDFDAFETAYLSEIRRVAGLTASRRLTSVFFGGGTPSLMKPSMVANILQEAARHWQVDDDTEITLEANPTSVEAASFAGFRAAGVNRVSIGVQALDNADLQLLGRLHTAEEAIGAVQIARSVFARVSFDLIYARQFQTLDAWQEELTRALEFGPDHLSLYQLTIEPGTAFGERFARGRLPGLPSEDLAADMFLATQELCSAYGLDAYEVSNHGKPGAESRHNLIYWRYGDYAGIGPGAHGRVTSGGRKFATETYMSPKHWLEKVQTEATGEIAATPLSDKEQAEEYLMMSLRLVEGTELARYEALAGQPLESSNLGRLQDMGMVTVENGILAATLAGRMVLNAVLRELIA